MRQPNPPPDGQRGSATVLAAFLVAVLLTVAVAGLQIGAAVVDRHRAQAAADLAALAGAAALSDGPDVACARAQQVVAAAMASDMDCRVEKLDVLITVTVGAARAAARAGPVDAYA